MLITKYIPGSMLTINQQVKGYKRKEDDRPQMFIGKVISISEHNIGIQRFGKFTGTYDINGLYKIQISEKEARDLYRDKVKEIVTGLETVLDGSEYVGNLVSDPDSVFEINYESVLAVAARLAELHYRIVGICEMNSDSETAVIVYENKNGVRLNVCVNYALFSRYYNEGKSIIS